MPVPLLVAGAARVGIARIGGFLARKLSKKVAKKVIVGAATVGTAVSIFKPPQGGLSFPGFPKDLGKVGAGIFGSSKGRIAAGDMGACPSGYHLNKHRLTDGTEPRTVCVRNRSINYANGRAARRAGRRLRGTVKMLKRSFSLVAGKPPKGKFIPRK